ncbi:MULTISPECIES: PH domain-containing protein [unclassified Streptomyces]|uniref:PH domain-containing protein n=1 Tax=unclassified Streptomyces TaxID=2593676 RepID=UPI0038733283
MATVDREGIVVRGLRRSRRLTWDGIHDIRCVAVPPSRRWGPDTITYAYRTGGRCVLPLYVDDEEIPAVEPTRGCSSRHGSADRPDRISCPQSGESGVVWVTFEFNDLTCRIREHLLGVPGDCLRT